MYDSEATFLTVVFLATRAFFDYATAVKLIPPINVITDNTNIDFFNIVIFTISFLQNFVNLFKFTVIEYTTLNC